MTMTPHVSINLCCYNSARFLEETLQSVFVQTYTDWELVIVDDASTDGTDAVIQRHIAAGRPIVYHRAPRNMGEGAARDLALRLSRGTLIAFIDHDDVWVPHKLARQVPRFERDPRLGIVYSDCLNLWGNGHLFRQFQKLKPASGEAYRYLLRQFAISIQTAVVHRRVLEGEAVGFDPRFQMLSDMDFFLRIAYRWWVDVVNEPLVCVRMHQQSLTHTRPDRMPVEMRMVLQKQRDLIPDFDRTFAGEAARFEFGIARLEARLAWARGRRREAMEGLRPYRWRYVEAFRDRWLMQCVPYASYQQVRVWLSRGAQALRLTRSLGCPSIQ
ncbi:MAG: glycosyltransferase family 2 protein [Candidatus Omnitrophica bacterium]|nr:glycosyltransferase family 2 protein [Candidatus Omnitrophota bacterium]